MFRHIVLFRIWDDVTDAILTAAMDDLRRLGDHAAVTEWNVALSLDTRKGRIVIEEGTFANRSAFEAWRVSDEHLRVAAEMAQIADWWVGDRYQSA